MAQMKKSKAKKQASNKKKNLKTDDSTIANTIQQLQSTPKKKTSKKNQPVVAKPRPQPSAAVLKRQLEAESTPTPPFPPGLIVWAFHDTQWWPGYVLDGRHLKFNVPQAPADCRLVRLYTRGKEILSIQMDSLREFVSGISLLRSVSLDRAPEVLAACMKAMNTTRMGMNSEQRRAIRQSGPLNNAIQHLSNRVSLPPPEEEFSGYARKDDFVGNKRKRRKEKKQSKGSDLPMSAGSTSFFAAAPAATAAPAWSDDYEGGDFGAVRGTIPLVCPASRSRLDISRNVFEEPDLGAVRTGSAISVFSREHMRWFDFDVKGAWRDASGADVRVLLRDRASQRPAELARLGAHKWRLLPAAARPRPPVSYDVGLEQRALFGECMARAVKDVGMKRGARLVAAGSLGTCAAEFVFLDDGRWLSDALLFRFAKAVLFRSTNAANRRVCVIDPLMSAVAAGDCGVPSMPPGVALYDVDLILWPVVDSYRRHWMLCVGCTATRHVYTFDPFNPFEFPETSKPFIEGIVHKFNAMSAPHDAKYGVEKRWCMNSARNIAQELRFPHQAQNDKSNCGVLVCLYMWALIVHQKCPEVEGSFEAFMEKCRVIIGCKLASPVHAAHR